ncbi:hypothetical protein FHS85_000307 [Rhodoligotrophos appendicifer]|uniref:Zn-ribbon domain-containing OB-fold protein n=1 Tax=Rhodoligotrophos appendicifer TaxID=987056 RepID=UPI00117FD627|nr:Zn-ribbon domain-containing OB-fold protein [Rhodoligotrophos appendicifer]
MTKLEFDDFFQAARSGSLAFPHCKSCGQFHWYPMKRCPHCRSEDLEWVPSKGQGTLYSWTVVRHPFDEAMAGDLPYIVALIEFPDAPGIRLVSNLVDVDVDDIKMGMELSPVYPDPDQDPSVVRFRPTASSAGVPGA